MSPAASAARRGGISGDSFQNVVGGAVRVPRHQLFPRNHSGAERFNFTLHKRHEHATSARAPGARYHEGSGYSKQDIMTVEILVRTEWVGKPSCPVKGDGQLIRCSGKWLFISYAVGTSHSSSQSACFSPVNVIATVGGVSVHKAAGMAARHSSSTATGDVNCSLRDFRLLR
ncbi:hypothetical protein EVAR_98326_1 [Eumeta japonica]|uniref:Uncharacterized protein n=1 Tax=Eumeta variegata TaxID=151549 RepID=A0A4C1XDM5_EUMVA|nr:hypothetical protein EVAR_98326_1 [Eumeta japonica]